MTEPDIVDRRQREAALDPLRSFCVSAPAGSGKTELLIQRFLTLLARVECPEQIIAITFTRKAVAEMRQRVLAALEAAQTEQPVAESARRTWSLARKVVQRDSEFEWALLDTPSRLKILTIDALCASLSRRLPLISGLGGSLRISDDPEKLYLAAVADLFTALESNTGEADDLALLIEHVDGRLPRLQSLLVAMLARRDQWLPVTGGQGLADDAREILEHALATVIVDHLEGLLETLAPFEAELCKLSSYAATELKHASQLKRGVQQAAIKKLPPADIDSLESWRVLADLWLTATDSFRRRVDRRDGFPPEDLSGDQQRAARYKKRALALLEKLRLEGDLEQQMAELRHLPSAVYEESQWQLLAALTRLLPSLVARLQLQFQLQAELDYIAISDAAIRALGSVEAPTDLALKLDYRIKHILIDEFQDTSINQFALLERLTAGWRENNQIDPGNPNTLFVVGDAMQSIYGFRDADVGLFLRARDIGVGDLALQPLQLQQNFRSDQNIVDWINAIFVTAFPVEDDLARGAIRYTDSYSGRLSGDSSVRCIGFVNDRGQHAQAAEVARLATNALAASAQDQVAILVRSRAQLVEILPALAAEELSWQATDIDPLATSAVVMDLLQLTKALLDPSDRSAWLAILRAPWCGLDNADLLVLAETTPADTAIAQTLFGGSLAISEDGSQRLQRVVEVLVWANENKGRLPLRRWVEGVWLSLGAHCLYTGQNSADDAQSFLDLLESLDQGADIADIELLIESVDKLFASSAADSECRLQIMTLHKAKGLEFDSVILPALDRGSGRDQPPLLMWQQHIAASGEAYSLISPIASAKDEQTPIYQYLQEQQKRKVQFENTRLFYVGATRAKLNLFLLAGLNEDKKGNLRSPKRGSLLACAWEAVEASMERVYVTEQDIESPRSAEKSYIRRIPLDWKPLLPESESLVQAIDFGSQAVAEDVETSYIDNRMERHAGSVAHFALQCLHRRKAKLGEFRVEEMAPSWRAMLQSLGLYGEDLKKAEAIVERCVTTTLTSDSGKWLFDPGHSESASELGMSSSNGDFVIDLCFVDADGMQWIVDYKTSVPGAGETLESFLEDEATLYTQQLLAYRRLMEPGGRVIRTALYFPRLGRLKEVEP